MMLSVDFKLNSEFIYVFQLHKKVCEMTRFSFTQVPIPIDVIAIAAVTVMAHFCHLEQLYNVRVLGARGPGAACPPPALPRTHGVARV